MSIHLSLLLLLHLPPSITSLGNWAGNQQFQATEENILTPNNERELIHAVKSATGNIKPMGSRHSFSSVADTMPGGTIIRMTSVNQVIDCCYEGRVIVQPGITYAALGEYLNERGFGLANYASLPHLTVGGAIMTSTHGSGGLNNNILAGEVLSYEMVTMDDMHSVWDFHQDDIHFYSNLVSLGSVGILTSVTLKVEPQYDIKQCIYPKVSWDTLLESDEAPRQLYEMAYSVSAFTDWKKNDDDGSYDWLSSIWLKHKLVKKDNDEDVKCPIFQGVEARNFHPIPSRDPADDCSPVGVGPSHVMLPHFLPHKEPSAGGDELQSEYFISLKNAKDALHALRGVAELLAPYVLVSEFRVVASDQFPLSVCYSSSSAHGNQPCFGMHFTWINDVEGVRTKMLPLVESTLSGWDPRPHHGKLHTLSPSVWRRRYSGYKKVLAASLKFDPNSRLENDMTRRYLKGKRGGGGGGGGSDEGSGGSGVKKGEELPLKDPAFQKMADEFRELADQMSEMDLMDQILIDQVDDVLSEDAEDVELLSVLGDQIGLMESSELYYDGL